MHLKVVQPDKLNALKALICLLEWGQVVPVSKTHITERARDAVLRPAGPVRSSGTGWPPSGPSGGAIPRTSYPALVRPVSDGHSHDLASHIANRPNASLDRAS